MVKRLMAVMLMAMVVAMAGVAYNGGIAAADEPVPPPTIPGDDNESVDQQLVETQETASTPKSGDVGGAETMGLCLYQTLADWPHYSRGDVSAHGFWRILPGGDCPSRAWVTIWLYEWQCDDDDDCHWEQIDRDRRRVREGGGRGNRAIARAKCRYGRTMTGFRATVGVDIPGVIDPPDRYTVIRNVDCRVSSSGRQYDE